MIDPAENRIMRKHARENSLIIAIFYVGLGTVSVMSVYPASPLSGDWVLFGLLLTFPVTFVSFGIMYANHDAYLLVLGIQIIIFLIFWGVLYRHLLKKYEERARQS